MSEKVTDYSPIEMLQQYDHYKKTNVTLTQLETKILKLYISYYWEYIRAFGDINLFGKLSTTSRFASIVKDAEYVEKYTQAKLATLENSPVMKNLLVKLREYDFVIRLTYAKSELLPNAYTLDYGEDEIKAIENELHTFAQIESLMAKNPPQNEAHHKMTRSILESVERKNKQSKCKELPNAENKLPKFFLLPLIIAAILFVSVADLPYGFYTAMRIVVPLLSGIYITFAFLFTDGEFKLMHIPNILTIILWNPILPVYLDKETWVIIDIIVGICEIAVAFYAYRLWKSAD